ncbi:tyrosine-protein phosphatase non-receptor type 2-like [Tropilaelaps mercedesae]|uniref:protein-tyrosine-phosphatase n=1 Tax=Tropilaelaps mercedesae TaxID=418985 RepID=A0A1V9XS16_9ACAR|nr:tyrosine-protein phosphatase non-receptor type 2-like [Tropilaelaps mercedesae]
MSSIEAEFCTIEEERSWQQVFATIRVLSFQHQFTTKEAKRAQNRNLNRYRDVSPYDHSRVVLHRSDVDYINASVVPVKNAGREYILTQGPLATTLPHFWLMVWEKNTKVSHQVSFFVPKWHKASGEDDQHSSQGLAEGIVMLNKLVEKNAIKCHQYWPDGEEREMDFESVDLRVSFVAESAKENYICRLVLFD